MNKAAEAYGKHLLHICDTTVRRMVEFLEKLQKRSDIRPIEVLESIGFSDRDIGEYRERLMDAESLIRALGGAAMTGAGVGASTWALVGLLGTASTGTAISGLSGAAATNATLAWLGGGSLAAGGGGMALGTVVLGGIVVGPALAITGLVLASKGEKALTQAMAFEKRVAEAVEELSEVRAILDSVRARISELDSLVSALDSRAQEALQKLEGRRFDSGNKKHLENLATAMQLVRAMVEIMRTRVVSEDGTLTVASHKILEKYRNLVEEA